MSSGETKAYMSHHVCRCDAAGLRHNRIRIYEVDPSEMVARAEDRCLGTCYEGTVCNDTPIEEMNCWECLAVSDRSWKNDPCPASNCGCTCDSMCWNDSIGGCPE